MKKQTFYFFIILTFLSLAGCASQLNSQDSFSGMPVAKNTYPMPAPGNNIIGQVYQIEAQPGITFDKLAEKYDIGAQEIMDANPNIKANRIHVGSTITIPTEYILPPQQYRNGVVINLAERRLYYFDTNNNTVATFPVAVGRQGWRTPLGKTYVYRKEQGPTWHVPKSIRDAYFEKTGEEHPRSIGPGPENPLGDYAIYLHMDGYLIHGTNNPASIGRSVSSGCIRMFNSDVAELYNYVKRGTYVNIIYYPNKVGWRDGKLYLESHTPQHHADGESISATQAILEALKEHPGTVDWKEVKKVVQQHRGIPTVIGVENG